MRSPLKGKNNIALIVIVVLFAGISAFRLLNLHADTPFGISVGQELSTDPPQYTSFARNNALFGEWEVFYTRYVLFVKNITTYLAYPVFKILGTGRTQSNLVAALLNILTILFGFLIWKKKGYPLAIAATAILGFNFIFLSYGKLTFLEVTTVCLISAGSYLLLTEKNRIAGAVFSGILFSGAAFFSKLLAIVFLPLAIVILVLEVFQTGQRGIFKKYNPLYAFLTGYAAVFIAWLTLVYMPSRGEVSGYVSEFSTGMYGMPKALESVRMFFVQLFSYGFDIRLWSKQPITFAAGFLGASALGGMLFSQKKDLLKKLDRIDLFFVLWFMGIFITLFPWNYRPLRYALLIFPPMCYLAARWLMLLIEPQPEWGKRVWPFYLLTFFAGSLVTFHLLISSHFDERSLELILKFIPIGIIGGVVITLIAFVIHRYRLKKKLEGGRFWFLGKTTAIVLIVGIVAIQVSLFFANSFKNQDTIYNASLDLGEIVSSDATVIGSYSSALTQNNHLRSVIKMFSVPVVEKDIFLKVPATHIAVEAGGGETSNEGRAFKDYPEILKGAPIITTYYLRGYPVNVYLISQNSPNPAARAYKPSVYEQAAIQFAAGKADSAFITLQEFEKNTPGTMSARELKMKMFLAANDIQNARAQLEEIAALDKGNLNIWLMLGDIDLKNNPQDINGAYAAYEKALYLRPEDKSLIRQLELLKKYLK